MDVAVHYYLIVYWISEWEGGCVLDCLSKLAFSVQCLDLLRPGYSFFSSSWIIQGSSDHLFDVITTGCMWWYNKLSMYIMTHSTILLRVFQILHLHTHLG